MDFEKIKEKTFDNAYKGNIEDVIAAIEEYLRLLKEVDIVSNIITIYILDLWKININVTIIYYIENINYFTYGDQVISAYGKIAINFVILIITMICPTH